jgi:hypothetical protein
MLLKPFNEANLWRGKLQAGQASVQIPPMVLPEINHIVGGTKVPGVPIWDEIRQSYEVKSAEYWQGVKKRTAIYRSEQSTPPYRRMCLGCM